MNIKANYIHPHINSSFRISIATCEGEIGNWYAQVMFNFSVILYGIWIQSFIHKLSSCIDR